MALPTHLMQLASKQLGLIRRAQILAAGIARTTLDTWIDRGVLVAVERGVYRLPGPPLDDQQRLLAAVYRAGEDARVTGWSACALHRLEGFDLDATPWIAVPRQRQVTGVTFVVQRTTIPVRDRAKVGKLPTVKPVRALIDAATKVDGRAIRVAIDDGLRRGLFTRDKLSQRAESLRQHRGAMAILDLFESGMLDQESELERKLALELAAIGLYPAWGMEVLPGIRPDAVFPEASYLVECDGAEWHSIESDLANDITREGVLRNDGWHIDRIRDEDLAVDRRTQTAARIAATRRERIAAGLGRPEGWQPQHPGRRIAPPRAA